MATVYKSFTGDDITTVKSPIYEEVSFDDALKADTTAQSILFPPSEPRYTSIKTAEGIHLFDMSLGAKYGDSPIKKISYRHMAQVLLGYDVENNIRTFELNGGELLEAVFISVSRIFTKDELRKNNVSITVNVDGVKQVYKDSGVLRVDSPVGEYGVLKRWNTQDDTPMDLGATGEPSEVGLIFYQAGVIVLHNPLEEMTLEDWWNNKSMTNFSFHNVTELNSAIHWCRINHNEYNYSSNQTYLDDTGKIHVKGDADDHPATYITTVGLYSADNELLAVAKLSQPLRKDPETELGLKVRLDY